MPPLFLPRLHLCPAIEDRNNALELHSRNNARLLDSLGGLAAQLTLDPEVEDTLRFAAISPAK